MSWVVTGIGVGVGTTALGAVQANQNRIAQQRANQQNANISAAQTQYSPWTGIKGSAPNIQATPDNTASTLAQGALGSTMFGVNLKNKLGETPDPDFKDENFMDTTQKAAPISPTSGGYVPVMDEMQREDDLAREARQMYLPRKPMYR